MSCLHSHVSYDDVQSKKIYGERSLQSFTLHLFVPSTTDVFKVFFKVSVVVNFCWRIKKMLLEFTFLLYFVHPDSFLHSNVVNSIEIQWFWWYWFRFDIEDWSGFNFAFYVTWNTKMYIDLKKDVMGECTYLWLEDFSVKSIWFDEVLNVELFGFLLLEVLQWIL